MPGQSNTFSRRFHNEPEAHIPQPATTLRPETEIEYLLTALDEERTARNRQKKLGMAVVVGVGIAGMLLGSLLFASGDMNGTGLANAAPAVLDTEAEPATGIGASVPNDQSQAGISFVGATAGNSGTQAGSGGTVLNAGASGGFQTVLDPRSFAPSGSAIGSAPGTGSGNAGSDSGGPNSSGSSGGSGGGGSNSGGGAGGFGSGGSGTDTGGANTGGGTSGAGSGNSGNAGNGGQAPDGSNEILSLGLDAPGGLSVNLNGSASGVTLDVDNDTKSLLDADINPNDTDSPLTVHLNGNPVIDGNTLPGLGDLPGGGTPDAGGLLDEVVDTLGGVLGNSNSGNSLLGGLLNE